VTGLSVVIPTRDRAAVLLETLDRLDAQETDGPVEVVVVDNGSRDGTLAALRARAPRWPTTVLEEPRPGPAAARNRGVAQARHPVVLFLGDDMAPASADFLAGHARLHAARPEPGYAVLGAVAWRPDREVTPFMHWTDHGGPQFAFHRLAPGPVAPAEHLYTSNVSLKRAALEAVGGFDERFPLAAVEDAELGVRLQRAGLELDFHPELLVHHDHPTDLARSVRRMRGVGASARLLHEIWPEDRSAGLVRPAPHWPLYPVAGALAGAALALPLPLRVRRRLWAMRLMAAYVAGYRAGAAGRGTPR